MSETPPAFAGVVRIFGPGGWERISRARVMVIGLGGVGSWMVEGLARSGVGGIDLVDLDEVCVSNINRQSHALYTTVGKAKVDLLAERVAAINPAIQVTRQAMFYTAARSAELLALEPTLVMDAIDSIPHKCHLLATCQARGIPVITTGGGGGKRCPEQIEVADLAKTRNDPLLARTRKILRQKYGFPRSLKTKFRIPAIYSPEEPQPPLTGDEETLQPGGRLDCAGGLGSLVTVTASLGFIAANVALRRLAEEPARTIREQSPTGIDQKGTT